MKTELTLFKFGELAVRIAEHNGDPWFVATDVCSALEIQNVSQALQRLDDDERSMLNIGRQGETNIVNESGLYSLILGSRKEEAKRFKKWVTSEVLPSIRKTGSYGNRPQEVNNAAWQAARLGEKLLVTTHPELRRVLWAGMDRYCKMLGITTPALHALGHQALPEPLEATEFWVAYDQLTNVHHCNLNHARTRGLVAVQLHQVLEAATLHGLPMAERPALMHALRYSDSRAFKGVRTVNSAESGKSVKCWVFADR